jgi:hypothetical protein
MAVVFAGIPSEKAAVMAQWKKRAAARRGKVATRDKARKPVKSVHGKATNRTRAKTTPRKRLTKAKPKRAVVKKAVPTVETVIVDMIDEPVPGVMAVTEFLATGMRGADWHRLQRPVDRLRDLIIADRAHLSKNGSVGP